MLPRRDSLFYPVKLQVADWPAQSLVLEDQKERAGADEVVERPGLTRGALATARPSALPDARAGAPRTAPRTAARTAAREKLERCAIFTIVGVSVLAVTILMCLRIASSNDQERARATIDQAFSRVHARQREYRSLFGRFASWPELKERGVVLGRRQAVLAWNADLSHWFLSIRDVDTGVICDRTGEIFDEDWTERLSACRPPK